MTPKGDEFAPARYTPAIAQFMANRRAKVSIECYNRENRPGRQAETELGEFADPFDSIVESYDMSHHELSVYRAQSVEEANIIVAWLGDHGIEALVPERSNSALGLPNVIPSHVEVCVADADKLDEARDLVAEHEQHLREHVAASTSNSTIELTCPQCNEAFSIKQSEAGKVVECPECHEYIDAPEA